MSIEDLVQDLHRETCQYGLMPLTNSCACWGNARALLTSPTLMRAAAHIAELEAAVDRVRNLHSQHSDIGLAPGRWCPGCGDDVPCATTRALRGDCKR